jgi:hypothetical protein
MSGFIAGHVIDELRLPEMAPYHYQVRRGQIALQMRRTQRDSLANRFGNPCERLAACTLEMRYAAVLRSEE